MKKIIVYILFISNFIFCQIDTPTTVDSVDLNKYSGLWYEIAKIPNSFQDHCMKNTTAEYDINDDGDIKVVNRCIDFDNEMDEADGIARIVDEISCSKLEVSFVSIFGWYLFWGDYWILGLDENYQYVAVGTPSRKYGWILARKPKLNSEDLEKCFESFESNGYRIEEFEMTEQDL